MNFKMNNFDFLRFFAASQVLVAHSLTHFGIGDVSLLEVIPGVPIFFTISGFLMSASWESSRSLEYYCMNSVLSIYPALLVCYLFSLMVLLSSYSLDVSSFEFVKWSVAQLTVGQFYNPDFLSDYGMGVLNGSLWTIPVELQFYMVLPFFYIFMNKFNWNKWVFLSVLIFFSIINVVSYNYNHLWNMVEFKLFCMTVMPYLNMFLFGVLLQSNLWFVEKYLSNSFILWVVIYGVLIFVFDSLGFSYVGNGMNPISAAVLSCLVVSFAYSFNGKFGKVLKGNDMSYGMYMYHMIFINLLIEVSQFDSHVNFILVIFLTLVTAMLSWRFIERPMLKMKSSYLIYS